MTEAPGTDELADREHLSTLGSPRAMGKLAGVYAGSRVLGLVRELAVAYALGTSAMADRVSGAFVVASATGLILGEAVFAGAVSRIGETADPQERARRYAQVFRVSVRIAALTGLVYTVLGPIATVSLLGTWEQGLTDTVVLALLLVPSVAAYVLSAAINGWLTIQRRYLLVNGVQTFYSIGTVALLGGAWAAGADLEAEAIVAGWSVGNLAALAVLVAVARPSQFRSAHGHGATLLKLGAPLAIGSALLVAQSITDRAVVARLETGDVAALGYAERLFLLPVGFALAVIGPIVLGSVTVAAMSRPGEHLARVLLDHLRLISGVTLPVTLAFAALAPLAVPVLFQYGAFTTSSTDRTVEALNALATGLAATAMVLVLLRVLQATGRRSYLMRLTGMSALINLGLSVPGGALLGLKGVALATSCTAALTAAVGIERVGRDLGPRWLRDGRRVALVPVVGCTGGLVALLVAEWLELVPRGIRLAIVGAAALIAIAVSFATGCFNTERQRIA